ncbi:MAG: PadR family transcriptional regulator [Cyanobacteria bacterium J06639_1]
MQQGFMSLSHTILMLLAESAHSGYDLSKEFDECVGHYWQATPQQIYRELSKLDGQGLVEAETIAQEGRPNKKLYTITAAGKLKLVEWLTEPADPMSVREDLMVKMRGSHLIAPDAMLTELQRRQAIHEEKLEVLRANERDRFANPDSLSDSEFVQYLTFRCGIRYESGWAAWCAEAIERIQQRVAQKQRENEKKKGDRPIPSAEARL